MILKPGKNLSEVKSYRPISLLAPIMPIMFEKLMLKRLKPIIVETPSANSSVWFQKKISRH
jgi:hypothetical protein